MGLLRVTNQFKNGDHPSDLEADLIRTKNELQRIRRHNDSLVSQVNNLLHFINEQNQRKRNLQQRISINPKTGLGNHNKMDLDLQEYFSTMMQETEQTPGALALIKLDNNFDIISKTLKSSVSEWILYQMGSRLKEILNEGTPIYHTREEEFVLHLKDMNNPEDMTTLLDEIYQQISKPHIFSGYHIVINCNIGVSFYPADGVNKGSLLNHADIALSFARKTNRNYAFFSEHMKQEVVHRMELQNSIIKALEEQSLKEIDKQFFINMQPIVTLNSLENGKPVIERIDSEALIRWQHPEKGIIAPDNFIPIAEETGLIIIIGKWVLYTATSQLEKWNDTNLKDSRLAINVSPRQFKNNDLIDSIERIVKRRDINPGNLQVEITENSFLDEPEEAARKIYKLKDIGIKIAIDDFGTGFSSINYLRKLPVDVVKIDRSFISDITSNQQDRSIVRAMIAMTAELGMENVVEGVETLEQIELLMKFGIKRFQGFYFSKALSPEGFLNYYTEHLPNAGS